MKKNKPYKLGKISEEVKRRNILHGIVPSQMKYRESLPCLQVYYCEFTSLDLGLS